MFKFAKNVELDNEKVNINIINTQICRFENGKTIKENIKELEVNIEGNLDDSEYSLHFIINESIDSILNLNKGQKIRIQNIIDNYFNINGIAYLDIVLELDILRIDKKFIFTLTYKDYDEEFFGTSEFIVNLYEIVL